MPTNNFVNDVVSDLAHLNLKDDVVRESTSMEAIGGYSDVFIGSLKKARIRVAIKRIRASMRNDPHFVKSFMKELTISSKLNHSNIVILLGYILEEDFPSLVSEWADNGGIMNYLALYPDSDIVRIAYGIAKGLKYLHDLGIIHADIKSDNVLISDFGEPMITDFGLSQLMTQTQSFMISTDPDAIKGTVRWMALELLDIEEGEPGHTKASDMWAYGMTVYELVTKQRPYAQFKSDIKVICAISARQLPEPPDSLIAAEELETKRALQSSLWQLSKRCWNWDPSGRLTADQAIHELSEFLEKPPSIATRFLFLKGIRAFFTYTNVEEEVNIVIKAGDQYYSSPLFTCERVVFWDCILYITCLSSIEIAIRKPGNNPETPYAKLEIDMKQASVDDGCTYSASDDQKLVRLKLLFGDSAEPKHIVEAFNWKESSSHQSKFIVLNKIGNISRFVKDVVDTSRDFAKLNALAKSTSSVAIEAFQTMRQYQECPKALVDLMEGVDGTLSQNLSTDITQQETRATLRATMELLTQMFQFFIKRAGTAVSGALPSSELGTVEDFKKELDVATEPLVIRWTQPVMRVGPAFNARDSLKPVVSARTSQGHLCMDGTRENVLDRVLSGLVGTDAADNLFWICGPPGFGKTCIAMSICEKLKENGVLVGAFFCQSDIPRQRDQENILPSLAHSFFILHQSYKTYAQKNVLTYEPHGANKRERIAHQLETLFVEPLAQLAKDEQESSASRETKTMVFIVDGLDECGNGATRLEVALALRRIAGLAKWLKVVVASRPLPKIVEGLSSSSPNSQMGLVQFNLKDMDAEDDLKLYAHSRLEALVKARRLRRKWLREDVLERLVKKAMGSFLWVSVAMEFLFYQYPDHAGPALESILSTDNGGGPLANMDSLYLTVLRSAVTPSRGTGGNGGGSGTDLLIVKMLLGIVRISSQKKPLFVDGLHGILQRVDGLSGLERGTVQMAMDDLQPVLYEDGSRDNIVRVCHSSFLDFLKTRERCKEFFVADEELRGSDL